jgi:hypothetical protein
LEKSASGESGGAAVAVGDGAEVVAVAGALVEEVDDGLGAEAVWADVSRATGGALVHPVTSAPRSRSPTAAVGIPIP